ncbi:hypothetical protein COU89_01105 [Candidatus Roizmanbacteria bacterium CG10_big_fil_rev_8_21_14_0_10_45_7]|uniref:PilN domain-containing protein n=1 Tax=Candidatus Roizmanbacteria bacterium CG10_big_fil_rev_8_21_14_0_10_45_7 TaxID=1974854 RepID=A0A2M8KV70_9BACT|nr:MAG: hypothetical protein COU89_01105 [Candidatus Roizmanbacteria bacterium CG10_big_fil_rev_8_21_14_0_10_45_7]
MSVISINLIKKSDRYRKVAQLTEQLKIVSIVIPALLFVGLVIFFILNNRLYQTLTQLTIDYDNLIRQEFTESKKIPEVAFSYGKLSKATEIYDTAPDYVNQYRYTIEQLIGQSPVEIESLNFTSDRTCVVSLLSLNPDDLYDVIQRIEQEQGKNNFSQVTLEGISTTDRRQGRETTRYFRVEFTMKFSPEFNEK